MTLVRWVGVVEDVKSQSKVSQVNVILKHVARDFVPPIVLRWLASGGPSHDGWGRPKFAVGGARLPGGRKFYLRSTVADQQVFRQTFLDREYSVDGMAQGRELSRFYASCEHPLIVDAGANIGAASVWFALKYPRATVVAIEPDKENYKVLEKNTKDFPSVIPVNAAIASTHGILHLMDPGQGDWGFRTASHATAGSYSVPAITVEEAVAKAPRTTPFILKMDIEGAESELFSRPSVLIENFPMIAIELHDWMLPGESNSRNFLKWHVEHERDLVFRGENAFSINTEFPHDRNSGNPESRSNQGSKL